MPTERGKRKEEEETDRQEKARTEEKVEER